MKVMVCVSLSWEDLKKLIVASNNFHVLRER